MTAHTSSLSMDGQAPEARSAWERERFRDLVARAHRLASMPPEVSLRAGFAMIESVRRLRSQA